MTHPGTLRGAIAGLGQIALRGHLPGWREVEGVAIVAGADSAWTGAEGALHPEANVPCYRSVDSLLAREELDFLDVCTPPAFHAEAAVKAIEKDLDVFCEKPLVLARADFDRMKSLAARKSRSVFPVHNWKHAPILLEIERLLRAGAIGTVRRVRWEVLRTRPSVTADETGNWRLDPRVSGGGILVDHGWHAFYLVPPWLPRRPDAVSAVLENREDSGLPIEDTATVRLHAGDAEAEIFLTWTAERRCNRARLEGERGTLSMEDDALVLANDAGERSIPFPAPLSRGSFHPEWFPHVARAFLREREERSGAALEEAELCLRLLLAAQASSAAGGARRSP